MTRGSGLDFYDPSTNKITIDTPEWKSLWETFFQTLDIGGIIIEPSAPFSLANSHKLFLEGKAAMTFMEELAK